MRDYSSLKYLISVGFRYDYNKMDSSDYNLFIRVAGGIDFSLNKTVTLEGGYDCGYASVTGLTTISGDMTVTNGTVVIGDIILQ